MIYDHKDADTLKKYSVRAFPTFVITDAEGTELMRQVGAPFRTPKDAIEWFAKVSDGLENLPKYEKAYNDNPEDVDAAIKLAGAYSDLGRGEKALELYEKIVAKLEKDDARRTDVQLKYAEALTGTLTRDNQAEIGKQVQAIYDEILPGLIKAKDERAVDPGIMNTRIKSILNKDHKAARADMLAMIDAFAKHDRVKEMKFFAAYYAVQDEDTATAKSEFEALVKAGPEDDRWVKAAKSQLDKMAEPADEAPPGTDK